MRQDGGTRTPLHPTTRPLQRTTGAVPPWGRGGRLRYSTLSPFHGKARWSEAAGVSPSSAVIRRMYVPGPGRDVRSIDRGRRERSYGTDTTAGPTGPRAA